MKTQPFTPNIMRTCLEYFKFRITTELKEGMQMSKIIDVQNLQMKFGKEEALKDVSFSVEKGEIFGFLGPSGSGKTTTIKILTAQLTHSSGQVSVFQQNAADMNQMKNKQQIGILTDNSGLYGR